MTLLPSDSELLRLALQRLIQQPSTIRENTLFFKKNETLSIHASSLKTAKSYIDENPSLLSSQEYERMQEFKPPLRVQQYYVGRVLAKRCWIDINWKDESRAEFNLNEMSIESDDKGAPQYRSGYLSSEAYTYLSITHTRDFVLTAASSTSSVGIDIEHLSIDRTSTNRWITSYPDDSIIEAIRKTIMNENSQALEGELPTILWSALEAGFKSYRYQNIKSPLDLTFLIEEGQVLIAPKGLRQFLGKG